MSDLIKIHEVESPLVVRTQVPAGLPYQQYRKHLRLDFFFQCAYCTMAEAEAISIRFTIDHYEPKSSSTPDTEQYRNLMWCCDYCNIRKGMTVQPHKAAMEGHRFYRPDSDLFLQHFALEGLRVVGLTNTGRYTETFLTLNRKYLRDVRELRQRLFQASEDVARGMRALRKIPTDRLPTHLKGTVHKAVQDALLMEPLLEKRIDLVLEANVRSTALDEDPDEMQEKVRRAEELKRLRVLYPGKWKSKEKTR